ncbi:MAG: hypothetical protein HYZ37_06030 [Candidatus Solibacter usitatus]|nr:hypothetical protein [Candidatus Solibacter usitatus]
MIGTLTQYGYLQLLDLLTTTAFLVQGVQEGNPVVRMALNTFPSPLGGLVVVKVLALILGIYCWRLQKGSLLRRVNIFFAALIAWNLVALISHSVLPNGIG